MHTFCAEIGDRADANDAMRMIAKDISSVGRQVYRLFKSYRKVSCRALLTVSNMAKGYSVRRTGKQLPDTKLAKGLNRTSPLCWCRIYADL